MTVVGPWDADDSDGRGLALDRLAEELERLADEGETPDAAALAARFGVEVADVDQCQRAIGALGVFGRPTPRPRPPSTSPVTW